MVRKTFIGQQSLVLRRRCTNASYSVSESELVDAILVVHASIPGTRVIGRLTAGNRLGLLVLRTTSNQELQHLRNSLPDNVVIQ